MVFGPWSHGDWAREKGKSLVGNVYFGDSIATFYQKNIESKFFHHFLKEDGSKESGLPEAYVFDTGKKEWKQCQRCVENQIMLSPKKSQFELQLAAIFEMRGAQIEAETKYKEIIADQGFNEDIRSLAIKRLLSFSQRPTVLH